MASESSKPARAAIAALLLSAVCGVARAQQLHEPAIVTTAAGPNPSLAYEEREEQAAARALAERRQNMIDDCEQYNKVDCERQVDTELHAEGLQLGAHVIHLRPSR